MQAISIRDHCWSLLPNQTFQTKTQTFWRIRHKMRVQKKWRHFWVWLKGGICNVMASNSKACARYFCMAKSKQHFLQLIKYEDGTCIHLHSPNAKSKDVWDEKGGNKDFEEFCGEDAAILHDSTLPHTQRHWTPGVLKVELSGKKKQTSHLTLVFFF